MRSVFRVAITLFLICPFLILLWKVPSWSLPLDSELLKVLVFTTTQALASAVFSLSIGFFGAMGLLWAEGQLGRKYKYLELLVLLPNLLPVLFVIVSTLNIIEPFPFGWLGIVIVHGLLNVGLVAVMFVRIFKSRLGGMAELAYIEGASRLQFFWNIFGYLRTEMSYIFLFVFSVCFTSFSVPLVLGGQTGTTFEVFIFEKIRIQGELGQALGLSCLQVIFLILFAISLSSKTYSTTQQQFSCLKIFSWPGGLFFPLVASLLALSGLFDGWGSAWSQWQELPQLQSHVVGASMGTFFVVIGTGFTCLSLLLLIAYGHPHRYFNYFLTGYLAPSSVLTGFALWLIGPVSGAGVLIKMSLGITLISLPLLYRMRWGGVLQSLERQIEVARVIGAKWSLIYFKIIFPQVIREGGYLAGLAALWAAGDFAFSKIIASKNVTLALVVEGLLGSYRLELATILSWGILAIGSMGLFIFWGVGNVLSKKSYS